MRNVLRLLVGIAVSVACLWFALRGTDWDGVAATLRGADALWTGAVALLGVAAIYIRAQRWRVLLRPVGDVGLYPTLSATAIGFGASTVLPFRIGEILRPAILGRQAGVGMSAALSSVVLERLLDAFLIISCFLALALVYPMPDGLRRSAHVLAGVAALGLVTLTAVQRQRSWAETPTRWVLDRLPVRIGTGLRPVVASFLNGLGGLADGRTVLVVLGYSVYLWGVIALTFLCALVALRIDVPLVAASLATVVIVAAFVFLPQAPGFVGTWQAGCVLSLGLFGVPKDLAVGFSLLTWIVQMTVNLGTAGVFLARKDFSIAQLRQVARRETPGAGVEG